MSYLMKKIVSASVLAAIVSANAYAGDDIKVTLGGRIDTQAGVVNEKSNYRHTNPTDVTSPQLRPNGIVTDTKLDIKIDATSDKGFTYGGLIRLNGDNSKSTSDSTAVSDRTFVYIQSNKFGRVEAGNMPGVGALLESDIDNFDVGTYGVNGYWGSWNFNRTTKGSDVGNLVYNYTNSQTLSAPFRNAEYAGTQFIKFPNLPSFYATPYYSNAPKVNYFTQFANLVTAGISFIPDMDSHGTTSGLSLKNTVTQSDFNERKNPASFRDVFSAGVRLEKAYGDYNAKLTATGETGKAKSATLKNLRAYEVGTMLGYKTFKLGASYGNWGKSLTLKQSLINNRKVRQDYWTAGFGQVFESWGYSVTHMESKKAGGLEIMTTLPYEASGVATLLSSQTGQAYVVDTRCNKFDNTVLDIDYKVAEGMKVYGAFSRYHFFESNGNKNRGGILMVGTRLLF